MAKPKVFISMGTPHDERHVRFRDELEDFLLNKCEVDPRIIDKNEFPPGNPLPKIREVMSQCNGLIAVAYERNFIENGLSRRGTLSEKILSKQSFTTVWNHIEIAMAYSMNIPIYVICEDGLTEDGLIETKVDWRVQYAQIQVGEFQRYAIGEAVKEWVSNRVKKSKRGANYIKALNGGMLASDYTPKEILGAIGTLIIVFAVGLFLGNLLKQNEFEFLKELTGLLK